MPKCTISSCKNSTNSRNGVSFFHFPSDSELAERWCTILAHVVTPTFQQRTAVVCSDHFRDKDINMCGTRHRLFRNATPDPDLLGSRPSPINIPAPHNTMIPPQVTMTPPQDETDSESSDEERAMIVDVPDVFRPPSECTVCRLCLLSEGTMERVSEELEEAYYQVTGLKWNKNDTLPQHLCWECRARLRGAAGLRARALAAHHLLRDATTPCGLTLNDVMSIDRSYHCLTSNLSQKHFPPNQYTINNQIFTKHTETNIELNINTDKIIESNETESRHFANIGNFKNIISITNTAIVNDNYKTDTQAQTKTDINKIVSYYYKNKTGKDIDASLNVEKVAMKETLETDESLSCLVINAEPVETVVRSECVDRADGGMPIDELIDMYNNDGDGDGRLRELNDQFEGATVQVDQGWGGYRKGGAVARPPPPPPLPPPPPPDGGRRRWVKSICHSIRKKGPYGKLDHQLFTITPVSEEEQLAEVLRRQEKSQYKLSQFKCHICFRHFTSQGGHLTHMSRHDAANGDYECHICKTRQKSTRAVKIHMYTQHTVRISCNKCSFVTMNRSVARAHGKSHLGNVYQCPYCPGHFDLEAKLKEHLRLQHVHAHACPACGLTFPSGKGLAVHRVKRHHGHVEVPPDGPYCGTCLVQFASPEAHARHLTLSSLHSSDNEPRFIGLRVADLHIKKRH